MAGETKEVADGYGRNYLLPKKLAVLANSSASNILEAQMKKVVVKRAQAAAEMTAVAEKINGVEITLTARVGEKERLYGSVTGADIATELNNITSQVVDKRKIDLEEPIRQLGTYNVTVRFTHDITADIKVTVEGEQVAEEKEEKGERKPRAKKEKPEKEAEAAAETGIDAVYDLIESSAVTTTDAEVVADAEAEAVPAEAEIKLESAEAVVEEKSAKEKKAKKPKVEKAKKSAEASLEEPEAKVEEEAETEEGTSEEKETEPGEWYQITPER